MRSRYLRKKSKVLDDMLKQADLTECALSVYNTYVSGGRHLDKNGHPDLSKEDLKVLIQFILPRLASSEAPSKYSSGVKVKARFTQFQNEGGVLWNEEMDRAVRVGINE